MVGGINLVRDGYGMPVSWLKRGPFEDYRIPGTVLVMVGSGVLAAAAITLRWPRLSNPAALVSGGAVLGYLVVEGAVMGYRGPRQLALNVAVAVPAVALIARGRRGGRHSE